MKDYQSLDDLIELLGLSDKIITNDFDAWLNFKDHRQIYDKLFVAYSQNIPSGPMGIYPDEYPIIIIGNWNSNSYGKKLYSKYNNIKNITLLNPIYSLNDLYRYRVACSVYIHGHSAGGTNPSLVEMMHFSKPIIAFDCSFNRASMENKGDYFDCESKLSKLVNNIENLCEGSILYEIAQRRYNWNLIRKQYLEIFEL